MYGDMSLSVNKLVVDVAGMGTVKGVTLAESGTIDLVGEFSGDVFLVPANLAALDGHDSLASGWTFTRNGGALGGYVAQFVEGGILVRRKGLSIILK